ncbi:MAG: nitrate reductase molybdenum cofactor assembly chaperone [Terriglobia bacterium]
MRVYQLFAKVLDYPTSETSSQVQALVSEIPAECPEAAELLARFYSACGGMTAGELQELYTSTFDMRPDCTTNLGHHLFGDDVRRNLFMAQLKERMEARRITIGIELPDHLSLVLRLLAAQDSADERQTLIADCLVPCITRMLQTFDPSGSDNPYAQALRALLLLLKKDAEDEIAAVGAAQHSAP